MRLDVKRLLTLASVEFKDSGKNVANNHVAIQCPFCGGEDPSQHMGINLTTGAWGCLRNGLHAGRNFKYLLERLVGSLTAEHMLGNDKVTPDNFDSAVASLAREERGLPEHEDVVITGFPTEFIPLNFIDPKQGKVNTESRGYGFDRFKDYLINRGFGKDAGKVGLTYELRGCLRGEWNNRVIFPIFDLDHQILGWYGRAIVKAYLRYKAFPLGPQVKTSVFNLPQALLGGKVLYLVEGPVDALKVDFYGSPLGSRAVALSSNTVTSAQVNLITRLAKGYNYLNILLDQDALAQAFALQRTLAHLSPQLVTLPKGVKDPGELTAEEVRELCR